MPNLSKRRLFFRTLVALVILAATLCGRFLYGLHAENEAMQSVFLPAHVPPPPGSTLLVIAPHCDDETLGVGGLIADASRRGVRVSVAFVTNGDGFPMAVQREYRRWHPGPSDYRRMARQRQKEARAALACLGVRSDRIFFLGYPDRGIAELWNQYWQPDQPYRSRFTGCDTSPYGNSFHPGARYCGCDLMSDLETLLQRVHPQWVYIPHPGDDHPDHWATHCFAMAALEDLRQRAARSSARPADPEWESVGIFTYLVHRGDWPVPQGLRRDARLVPPAPLAQLDTRWSSLLLTSQAEADKEAALLCYRSQTAVMKRFLTSFVRRDELFGSLPPKALAAQDLGQAQWQTAITDATGDTLLRGMEGGGDITDVKAELAPDRLLLRVSTRRPLSPRLTYTIRLHPLGGGAEAAEPLTVPFRHLQCQEDGVRSRCGANDLEINLPLSSFGRPAAVMLGADSRAGNVAIDRVAWRLLRLESLPRGFSAPKAPPPARSLPRAAAAVSLRTLPY